MKGTKPRTKLLRFSEAKVATENGILVEFQLQ